MQLTPLIAVHMSAALAAIAIGPLALWAREGATQPAIALRTIQNLNIGACFVAGGFTLLPGRYLGNRCWANGRA